MPDDLETGEQDALVNETPSPEQTDTIEEDKDLSNEEIQAEIDRLKEEVKTEEDAKEKRHKEQSIGWNQKVLKERDRAQRETNRAKELEEKNSTFEKTLINEAYEKTISDSYGLPYFEKLVKTDSVLAEKLAREKWNKSAKELILDTKRARADGWDEELKKVVNEEDIRSAEREKVYHEIAVENAEQMFNDLNDSEKTEAKEFFDDIIEGKKLTPDKAKRYAEMAISQATRNRPKDEPVKKPIDKNQIIADKAGTGITPKTNVRNSSDVWNVEAIRQQLKNAGITQYQIDMMYPPSK